jgi:hypothetical protein
LIALLGFGTLAGFASGFSRLCSAHDHFGWNRRRAFEQHVAELCTDAALRAQRK